MRRDLTKPDVPWTVRIAKADKDALVQLLPMQGAQTWIVQQAIESFLALMENAPHLRHWAREQITEMLYGEATSRVPMADINVRIPTDLYVRFSKTFPEFGAASWFMRRIVHALVVDLQQDITLEERVETVVNRVMQIPTAEVSDD